MTCATVIDETARLIPEPVVIVEVASPSTRLADVNDKVELYEHIPSVQHYLVLEQDQRRMVHYGRGQSGRLEPRIIREGSISLAPPGVDLLMEAFYRDTALETG